MTTFNYTRTQLLETMRFAKINPHGTIKINMVGGFPQWLSGAEYRRWFRQSLNEKINRGKARSGRKYEAEYQADLRKDAVVIKEHFANRTRRSGRNILSNSDMKRRFPQIDNPPREDY